MNDQQYETFQHYGTNAQRLAFTPAPAAGIKPLYIWYETDTDDVYAYTTGWHQINGGGGGGGSSFYPAFTPIVDADFAWVNQGGASKIINPNDGICIIAPNVQDSLRIRKKAAPSTPYTITLAVLPALIEPSDVGLLFRQSSDGKVCTCGVQIAPFNERHVNSEKWTDPTTYVSPYLIADIFQFGLVYLRIEDDGVDRKCYYSADGYNFLLFDTQTRTDFLIADEVGFYVNNGTTTNEQAATFLSWEEA